MKLKSLNFGYFLLLTALLINCRQEPRTELTQKDTTADGNSKIVVKPYNADEIARFKPGIDIGWLEDFDIDSEYLYTIAGNTILKCSLVTGATELMELNLFSASDNNMDNLVTIKKTDGGFYIVNHNKVVLYDELAKVAVKRYSQERIIGGSITKKGILVADYNSIKLLDNDLTVKDSVKFEFGNPDLIPSKNGFAYLGSNIFDFSAGKEITVKQHQDLSAIKIVNPENFYVALIDDQYLIGFMYDDRSKIFFINKQTYNMEKEVSIGNNFRVTEEQLRSEEGHPNIKIITANNRYYLLGLSNNNELILLSF